MEGDKVYLKATPTETNGIPVYGTEIGQKPLFMLDEEYVEQIIGCATEVVKMACRNIYPENGEMQVKIAQLIAKKAIGE